MASNLVPNSSFESGATNWQVFGTSAIDTVQPVGFHGTWAFLLRTGTSLQSGPIALNAGRYTFSLHGKVLTGLQGPYHAGIIASPLQDDNAFGHLAGSFSNAWSRNVLSFVAPSNGTYHVKFINVQPDLWIDAVQLETGTVATAYQPKEATKQSIKLSWDANVEPEVEGYLVLHGSTHHGPYATTNTVIGRLSTSVTVSNLPTGNIYFVVQAFAGNSLKSPFSNEVSFDNTPPPVAPTPPTAPKNLKLSATIQSGGAPTGPWTNLASVNVPLPVVSTQQFYRTRLLLEELP